MKTFLNSTVESSEDFCSHDSGIGSALAGKSESSIAQNTETESELKSLESGLEERRREEEVSARLQQLIQLLESVVELNSGLEEREEETHILTGQVEKATEELEEAERQEVEARREAVALQEQIEKMIQVEICKERCQSEENALIQ